MGYLMILGATLLWSLLGSLVKVASPYVSSEIVTFSRFFFALVCLLPILVAQRRKLAPWPIWNRWIWIGALGKAANYFLENIALVRGFSFGNVVVWPAQSTILLLFSALLLRERITRGQLVAVVLCILGVSVITWNGTPLEAFLGENLPLTLLYVFASFGASIYIIAQKRLIETYSSAQLNFLMFAIAALFTVVPAGVTLPQAGPFSWPALLALAGTGAITGFAFFLTGNALRTVPVFWSSVLQNVTVLLSLIWGVVFFHEPVTGYIAAGVAIFLCGMVLMNLPQLRAGHAK